MERGQGFAQQGGELVYTAGIASQTQVQQSLPFSTIAVYLTGTTTLAQLYADNRTPPTPLANPFTANIDGYWYFYAANGRYDVMITSPDGEVYPWTMGDLLLFDPSGQGGGGVGSQTPWLSNIDGGGFNLTNVGFIDVTGGYLVNGVPLANPNLWVPVPNTSNIYHQGFVGVINQNPQFALDVQGGVNCTDNFYINGVAISAGTGGGPWIVLGASAINYSGHVGINNANPQYALDVNGNINVSAGSNFFINGVAIGTGGGSGPWIVLTGNRITYAGQVGIGQNPPNYPLDVLGDVNITGAFRVNGVPIGGGGGQWISGANNVIYYNGGNVGIGTATPTVALQVPGTVAVGQLSMAGNPANPVINSNGAFIGAGVNVSSFGLEAGFVGINTNPVSQPPNTTVLTVNGDITCSYSLECAGQVIGSAFGIPAGSGGSGGGFVIDNSGQFIGAGVDVLHNNGNPGWSGPFGIACADLTCTQVGCAGPMSCIQTTGFSSALLAEGAIISADASGSTTGGAPANGGYYVNPLNQSPIQCINNVGQFVGPGINIGAQGITAGFIEVGLGEPPNTTVLSVQGDIQVLNSVLCNGQIIGSAYGITNQGFGTTGNFSTLSGYQVTVNQGLVMAIAFVGSGSQNLSVNSLSASTVSASNFTVAGGSPGIALVVSWYGASSSGGPANVEHQLVFEQGILVSGF